MLTDPRMVPADGVVETDVCIVGAGPAGITLACELAGLPLRVCLLEGGGFELEHDAQELAGSTAVSHHHAPDAMDHGRRRQFGGTSNMWVHETDPATGRRHARTLVPEPIDFEARDSLDVPGWPLELDDLLPFYERAQWHWNRGTTVAYDDPTAWATPAAQPIVDDELVTRVCQYGPRDMFTLRYRDDLIDADNVDLRLRCNVVELEPASGGGVGRIRVAGPDGRRFWVKARAFVLAGGCVENVQMLLADGHRLGAAGAESGLLGRFMSDHQEYRLGVLRPDDPGVFERIGFYDIRQKGRILFSGILTLAEEVKRKHDLLNMKAILIPQPAGYNSPAEISAKALAALARRERPGDLLGHLTTLARSPRDVAAVLRMRTRDDDRLYREFRGGWSAPWIDRSQFGVIEIEAATEQAPAAGNRLVLDDARDRLGRRRVRLHWGWTGKDKANLGQGSQRIVQALERAGLGRFEPWVGLDGPTRPIYPAIHHPMGGARMHDDPNQGVVDAACRVHGVDNLFVTGSAVFPNAIGYANPTLTVLALVIRLADRLKSDLG
jgi:choline dehydrogenase-like flavoprotein